MRKISLFWLFLLLNSSLFSQSFADYFSEGSLRINFVIKQAKPVDSVFVNSYTHDKYFSAIPAIKSELEYNGNYRVVVTDGVSKKILYVKGFCTLFEEFVTTSQASTGDMAFEESVSVPFPKNSVFINIQGLDTLGNYQDLFTENISPEDISDTKYLKNRKVDKILVSGDYQNCFDLVFLSEGYRQRDYKKFVKDVKRFSDDLFEFEPYKQLKSKINVWAVFSASADRGIDEPHWNKWQDTNLDFSFDFFGTERYIGTYSYWNFCSESSYAPGDAYIAVVNSSRYGGGGIYNHYSVITSDHEVSDYVLVHELGHSLAGLADEYYDSVVAYNDFFSPKFEPWHPNITNLVNFSIKWGDMIESDVPIPTPENYKYSKKVGVFEGAGYSAKGLYRPYQNCIMRSHSANSFCPVCQKAIKEKILMYVK